MNFPMNFIAAGTAYAEVSHPVSAPYLRRSFTLQEIPTTAQLLICGLGFYELYVNGYKITKGHLAPYISAPSHLFYYDAYEIQSHLTQGENVLGVWLGNGLLNNPGGHGWDFDKASWRAAPMLALRLTFCFSDGHCETMESDEGFCTADSPVFFDDYRYGEYYDARKELPGWNAPGFDACTWRAAVPVAAPTGQPRLCNADNILTFEEIPPVRVTTLKDGVLFDFGINLSGVCRLAIQGIAGQKLELYYAEALMDGALDRTSVIFPQYIDGDLFQKDVYICKGGQECYEPTFTYHGFQYVLIKGLSPTQISNFTLTALFWHSALSQRGGFQCSNETINCLQTLTRRSTLACFHYFPTDCPQREKNGWTADAALSAEHTLLNFQPDKSYREWLHNIRAAQRQDGSLPGIVPTGGWGYHWGNGPAWDQVLIELPYCMFQYRGDLEPARENADAILRYLKYVTQRIRPDGLVCWGLGDWCQTGREASDCDAPLEVTDTLTAIGFSRKAACLFNAVGRPQDAKTAMMLSHALLQAARIHLLNKDTLLVKGNCQTSQAMALYYGLFNAEETPKAFQRLLSLIEQANGCMNVGVLGAKVLFHVLAQHGACELAVQLIVQDKFPAYGWWLAQGATSLWESFASEGASSRNHHFWGDISHFFIRQLAGIHYGQNSTGSTLTISPHFVSQLTQAEGFYIAPEGEIRVRWKKEIDKIVLWVQVPACLQGKIQINDRYCFADGTDCIVLQSGRYALEQR